MDWFMIFKAFIVGGLICVIGQILIDKTKLTPARILVAFVTIGVILGGLRNLSTFNWFCRMRSNCSFNRNLLAKGAISEVKNSGLIGAFIGGTKSAAAGISAAIFFGYIASLISKPKIKKQ